MATKPQILLLLGGCTTPCEIFPPLISDRLSPSTSWKSPGGIEGLVGPSKSLQANLVNCILVMAKCLGYGSLVCDQRMLGLEDDHAGFQKLVDIVLRRDWELMTRHQLNAARDHLVKVLVDNRIIGRGSRASDYNSTDTYNAFFGHLRRTSCTMAWYSVCPKIGGGCGMGFGYMKLPWSQTAWTFPMEGKDAQECLDTFTKAKKTQELCPHCQVSALQEELVILDGAPLCLVLCWDLTSFGASMTQPLTLTYTDRNHSYHKAKYAFESAIHLVGDDNYKLSLRDSASDETYLYDPSRPKEAPGKLEACTPSEIRELLATHDCVMTTYRQVANRACGFGTHCGRLMAEQLQVKIDRDADMGPGHSDDASSGDMFE